jgi:two-component system, OmpR family, osmolarity sensor histidine kinase EnvZ
MGLEPDNPMTPTPAAPDAKSQSTADRDRRNERAARRRSSKLLNNKNRPQRNAGMRFKLTLFWRTFLLLGVLMLFSILAWLQAFRALEVEPQAQRNTQQVASLVNLARASLTHTDPIARLALINTLADQENLLIKVRERTDRSTPLHPGTFSAKLQADLMSRLGTGTELAATVNEQPGIWISMPIGADHYWLDIASTQGASPHQRTWMVWFSLALVLTLLGAGIMARLINRPLQELSFAASRVRDGDFDASHLDESVKTSEVREVNIGFNRMTAKLAKVEQDRALMLAGISHDLRTPLARLRLETEMSVSDLSARQHMASDIEQLDAIIDKFLDYARPDQIRLVPVDFNGVAQACAYAVQSQTDIRLVLRLDDDIWVDGDEVELKRVLTNLIENARRYGKSPEQGIALVTLAAKVRGDTVQVTLHDQGTGVGADVLPRLTQPFFRGNAARTAATGAGLGLSIVERIVQRLGGSLTLSNRPEGGLSAYMQFKKSSQRNN